MKDTKLIEDFVNKYKPQIKSEGMRSFVYKDYQKSRDEFIKDTKEIKNNTIKECIEKLKELYKMEGATQDTKEMKGVLPITEPQILKGYECALFDSIKTLQDLIQE